MSSSKSCPSSHSSPYGDYEHPVYESPKRSTNERRPHPSRRYSSPEYRHGSSRYYSPRSRPNYSPSPARYRSHSRSPGPRHRYSPDKYRGYGRSPNSYLSPRGQYEDERYSRSYSPRGRSPSRMKDDYMHDKKRSSYRDRDYYDDYWRDDERRSDYDSNYSRYSRGPRDMRSNDSYSRDYNSSARHPRSRRFGPHHPRGPVSPTNVLAVFNLPLRDCEEDLIRLVHPNKPKSISIQMKKNINTYRGYGFLNFDSVESASAAKELLTGATLDTNAIRVDFSSTTEPHKQTPGRYMGRADLPYNDRRYQRDHPY